MTASCPQCSMAISVEDARMPSEPFPVVCPRCRNTVTIAPPPKEEPKLASAPTGEAELLTVLTGLLSGAARQNPSEKLEMDKWHRRRVLLCLDDVQVRERVRAALDPTRYEVFLASQAPEATEILHESRVEAVVLSPTFDADHQGGPSIMQWVSRLTAQTRRRTYVVLISPQLRTLDTYLAFANSVNLTIHPEDLDSLQSIFERSVRDFNELYRPFNQASQVEAY